jgi:hypothetical protein
LPSLAHIPLRSAPRRQRKRTLFPKIFRPSYSSTRPTRTLKLPVHTPHQPLINNPLSCLFYPSPPSTPLSGCDSNFSTWNFRHFFEYYSPPPLWALFFILYSLHHYYAHCPNYPAPLEYHQAPVCQKSCLCLDESFARLGDPRQTKSPRPAPNKSGFSQICLDLAPKINHQLRQLFFLTAPRSGKLTKQTQRSLRGLKQAKHKTTALPASAASARVEPTSDPPTSTCSAHDLHSGMQ